MSCACAALTACALLPVLPVLPGELTLLPGEQHRTLTLG